MDCSLPDSSVHGDFSKQEYWSGLPCPLPGDFPSPGIQLRSPTSQADSLSEPPGKPKNTGVGSPSPLSGWLPDFLTQKLNWGLLHCRWILYQLSYPGSPRFEVVSPGLIFLWYVLLILLFPLSPKVREKQVSVISICSQWGTEANGWDLGPGSAVGWAPQGRPICHSL